MRQKPKLSKCKISEFNSLKGTMRSIISICISSKLKFKNKITFLNKIINDTSKKRYTSAQILPTIEIVSTGYNPRRVSAPRRIASLPAPIRKCVRKRKSSLHVITLKNVKWKP
jgi:hypothetical protein